MTTPTPDQITAKLQQLRGQGKINTPEYYYSLGGCCSSVTNYIQHEVAVALMEELAEKDARVKELEAGVEDLTIALKLRPTFDFESAQWGLVLSDLKTAKLFDAVATECLSRTPAESLALKQKEKV